MIRIYPTLFLLLLLFSGGCKKEPIVIPDNNAPYYGDVPSVLVKNYINRLYIDLIGREPLDKEMEADLLFLRDEGLAHDARAQLVQRLQKDTTFIEGDSSYNHAYYHRLYDLSKVRFVEGVSNAEIWQQWGIYHSGYIKDSINGDLSAMAEKQIAMDKLEAIVESENAYRLGEINLNEMCRRMIYNYFYDFINMGSFNMVNAAFNDLYYRYPTQHEFEQGFDMIEFNTSVTLFGEPGQNKEDFVAIMTGSNEFYEGLITWAYQTLLARGPTSAEVMESIQQLKPTDDFQRVQLNILITDEYANF